MEANRKHWNAQQQALRQALSNPQEHETAIGLFLSQHARLHASKMTQTGEWSLDDEVWQDLTEATVRRIPRHEEHSIAWCIWHLARIEDVTMNMLIAGTPQLFQPDGWQARMKVESCDTGNAMEPQEIAALSEQVDIEALRAYRLAVGCRTREIVQQIRPGEFKQKVDPARLEHVLATGAVVEKSRYLIDYWGGLTSAGLLLMPPTRHNLVHLNEVAKLKAKRQ